MPIPVNMKPMERWLRIYFGLIIFAIYFVSPFPYRQWTFSGLLLVATGITGYCPIYTLLRRRGNKESSPPKEY